MRFCISEMVYYVTTISRHLVKFSDIFSLKHSEWRRERVSAEEWGALTPGWGTVLERGGQAARSPSAGPAEMASCPPDWTQGCCRTHTHRCHKHKHTHLKCHTHGYHKHTHIPQVCKHWGCSTACHFAFLALWFMDCCLTLHCLSL